MKPASNFQSRGPSSSPPPAHRLSRAIAKTPPPRKIRIVHLLAPEVIKTEARHFRELVQLLTGKPPQKGSCAASASASTGGDASPSSLSPSPPTSVSSCDTAGYEGLGAAGIEMKAAETTSSPSGGEGGGFLRALELDGYDAGFYPGLDGYDAGFNQGLNGYDAGFNQGLEDLLFNPCEAATCMSGYNF